MTLAMLHFEISTSYKDNFFLSRYLFSNVNVCNPFLVRAYVAAEIPHNLPKKYLLLFIKVNAISKSVKKVMR